MTNRILVIGTGSIGTRHLVILKTAGVSVMALSRRRHRAGELTDGGIDVCGSIAEAAEDGIDSAIIASDTSRHVADAAEALAAGMHVLIEKPIAATLADAQCIRESARHAARQIFVGCTLRFSESLHLFRSWLPRIGRIYTVRIECQSYLPSWRPHRDYRQSYSARYAEGGVLRDLIHELDYAGWQYSWPTQVQATLENSGELGIEAEESADLFWTTAEGVALSIRLDYLARLPRRRMCAIGENGEIEWNGLTQRVELRLPNGGDEAFESSQTRDDMLLAQDRAFLDSCRKPEAVDQRLASLEDGMRAVAICDAARRSSQLRREESVASIDACA